MEEMAKTDPFVQDAMEGYQANPDHDHSVLLKVIADRIQHKNASRRPKILPLSKGWVIPAVAASLVLILATWAVMFYMEKQGDAVFVAAEPKASTSTEHSTEVNLSDADSLTDDVVANDQKAGSREQGAGVSPRNESKSTATTDVVGNHNLASRDFQGISSNDIIVDTTLGGRKATLDYVTTQTMRVVDDSDDAIPALSAPALPATQQPGRSAVEMSADKSMAAGAPASKINAKKDEGYFANQMNPDLMKQRVVGSIRGRKGETLFGAQIAIKNTNLITTSDYYGKFELYIPDSLSTIDVSLSGYQDTTMVVAQGADDLAITLDENNITQHEGVLAGAATRQEFSYAKDAKKIAAPPDYILFSTYVKENSKFPVQDNFTYTCKEVTISFTVSKNGRPELFQKIKTSEDLKYSSEALRLLKHGPDWQCDGVYPCVREYTIYFK